MTETLVRSDAALDAIQRYPYADNPSAFLTVNENNSYFQLPGLPGVIVYRQAGRYLVQFGGPFAPSDTRGLMLSEFIDFAAEQRREIVGVQLQGADTGPYLERGFTINQIGASYAVDLTKFTLSGTPFMQLRNKISRALRSGLAISEVPLSPWWDVMHELDAAWLTTKGDNARPLEFLVGQYGGRYQPHRRLFIGEREGRLMGYVSYSPVYGSRQGWMHDLSRRHPEGPPGVMEAINKAAIDVFQKEQVRWLHFGFTPFTGRTDELQFPGHSRAFHWLMGYLWEHGEQIYPAKTQLAYKKKWAPDVTLAEYVAFQHGASIPALVHIFRACNAV